MNKTILLAAKMQSFGEPSGNNPEHHFAGAGRPITHGKEAV